MAIGNGWKKISTWVGILVVLGTLSAWYASYANNNAKTCEKLDTHEIRLTKVERKQESQEPTMIKLEQYFQIISPTTWDRASRKADSVMQYREDSLNKLKDSLKDSL